MANLGHRDKVWPGGSLGRHPAVDGCARLEARVAGRAGMVILACRVVLNGEQHGVALVTAMIPSSLEYPKAHHSLPAGMLARLQGKSGIWLRLQASEYLPVRVCGSSRPQNRTRTLRSRPFQPAFCQESLSSS